MPAAASLQIDLDGAWPRDAIAGATQLDARALAPHLRYSATGRAMEEFAALIEPHPARFTLLGSGDFHHLSSVLVRRVAEPFTLVSFDNHPDWDIRPPRWCCGTWINRALEWPPLERVALWGCGNFELNWPSSLFANHRALRSGRLAVWPWTERLSPSAQRKWPGLTPENWREKFRAFAASLAGKRVYVTVDLDCLRAGESATNWEAGLFTAAEIAWCLDELARHAQIIAGDVCGAYSPPVYARFKQRIEGQLDHPKLPPLDLAAAQQCNLRALAVIWPALALRDERHSGRDEPGAEPEVQRGPLLQEKPGGDQQQQPAHGVLKRVDVA